MPRKTKKIRSRTKSLLRGPYPSTHQIKKAKCCICLNDTDDSSTGDTSLGLQKRNEKRDREVAWTNDCARSTCDLLDLPIETFKDFLSRGVQCSSCKQLLYDVDFTVRRGDCLNTQRLYLRSKMAKLLHHSIESWKAVGKTEITLKSGEDSAETDVSCIKKFTEGRLVGVPYSLRRIDVELVKKTNSSTKTNSTGVTFRPISVVRNSTESDLSDLTIGQNGVTGSNYIVVKRHDTSPKPTSKRTSSDSDLINSSHLAASSFSKNHATIHDLSQDTLDAGKRQSNDNGFANANGGSSSLTTIILPYITKVTSRLTQLKSSWSQSDVSDLSEYLTNFEEPDTENRIDELLEPLYELEVAVESLTQMLQNDLISLSKQELAKEKEEVIDLTTEDFASPHKETDTEPFRNMIVPDKTIPVEYVDETDDAFEDTIEIVDVIEEDGDGVEYTNLTGDIISIESFEGIEKHSSIPVEGRNDLTSGTSNTAPKLKIEILPANLEIKDETMENDGPEPPFFQCSICKMLLSDTLAIKTHMLSHSKRKPCQDDGTAQHICTYCNKSLMNLSAKIAHEKSHTKDMPKTPKSPAAKKSEIPRIRKKRVFDSEKWRADKAKKLEENPLIFQCDICLRVISNAQHLKEHKLIHTGERPFACNLCPKKYRQSSSLYLHRRRHENDLRYKCGHDGCDRVFIRKYARDIHEATHTKKSERIRNWPCEYCSSAFVSKTHLYLHKQRMHPECRNPEKYHPDKLPKCTECGKTYLTQRQLKIHVINQHDPDSKEFSCEYCGKRYATMTSLARHRLDSHEKVPGSEPEKIHECSECGKKFSGKSLLRRHQQIHESFRLTTQCHICSKYLKVGSMRVHMKTHGQSYNTLRRQQTATLLATQSITVKVNEDDEFEEEEVEDDDDPFYEHR